jgi:hypothetical protein
VSRWPERGEKDKVDRSRDPSGSWRGDGNQYLSPEQHDQAQAVIATVRAAEESISGHMQEIERENTCGSRLAGWDHRRKGDTRLKEKIAEEYGITPGLKSSGAMDGIHDAIRYTYCSKAADYADAFWNIKGLLESHGYRMNYSKNHWHSGQEYKGVNTRWTTPDNLSFEVQFHTPESFDAKQRITHSSYERGRNPLTTRSERRAIKEFHQVVYSLISAPDGSTGIPDHKEVG